MGLSRLSAKCQVCPFVDTCENKEMEALGFLPIPPGGLNNPDIDIKVGIDLAKGPDFSAEQMLRIEDKLNGVGNPYPASTEELERAFERITKEFRYGILD